MKSAEGAGNPGLRARRASLTRGALLVLLVLGLCSAGVVLLALPRAPAPPGPQEGEAVFPLPARYEGSYADDWGAERTQGAHEGTDLFAPEGTRICSITDGTVVLARGSDEDGWNTLGGYTVMVEAAYDAGPVLRGDLLYYTHMKAPSGLKPGEMVEAGQEIGEVGSTGQGPRGTRGMFEPHVHLGWYERGWFGGDRAETESGAMNPYPLLRRLGAGGYFLRAR